MVKNIEEIQKLFKEAECLHKELFDEGRFLNKERTTKHYRLHNILVDSFLPLLDKEKKYTSKELKHLEPINFMSDGYIPIVYPSFYLIFNKEEDKWRIGVSKDKKKILNTYSITNITPYFNFWLIKDIIEYLDLKQKHES